MDTWHAIAELVDGKLYNGSILKHTVFRSVHTSMAYLHQHAFEQLESFPLSLTQGDVRANLDALQTHVGQLDFTTAKIKQCMVGGIVPVGVIVRSLTLLLQTAASTQLVEKGHAGGAIQVRQHRLQGPESLAARCFMHDAKALLSASKDQILEDRLQANVDALDLQSNAEAVKGRSAFCRELFNASSARVDGNFKVAVGKNSISQHQALYANVAPTLKRKYTAMARDMTALKKNEHCLAIAAARTDLLKCKSARANKFVESCSGVIASSMVFVVYSNVYTPR
jgi:hypothetical protein